MANKSNDLLVILIVLIMVVLGVSINIGSKVDSIEDEVEDNLGTDMTGSLEVISTEPPCPAELKLGQKLTVKFRYDLGTTEEVHIWARPYTNGRRTSGYKAHGSLTYKSSVNKAGIAEGYFYFDTPTKVDEVQINMRDVYSKSNIATVSQKISATWVETNSLSDDIQYDPSVKAIVEKTKKELSTSEQYSRHGALVYQIRSADGQFSRARTEFHWTGQGRGGYNPGRISEEETKVMFGRAGQSAELRVIHPDYHEFRRPITFEKGKTIAWDDIVLERVSAGSSCIVKGIVHLEDDANPVDIYVSADRSSKTTANKEGEFILSNLRSGEIRIYARKPGYHGLYTTVQVKKGETGTCELKGYRIRKAKVRWAFQPDGSKNFSKANIVTGTAVLQDNILDRVSFSDGFKQVRGKSDFYVHQKEDTLLIRNTDVRRNGPAFIEVDGSFDNLIEAPDFGYNRIALTLKQGKVYVFRTYDGEKYAKMEVLEIID